MSKKQATSLARAAALAAVAMAAACTDAGESMRIYQNQVPEDGCVIPTAVTGNFRSRGVVETRSNGYVFTPVIQSLMVDDEDVDHLIRLRGADIDITFPDDFFSAAEEDELQDDALTRFSTSFSGSLPAEGTASLGFSILSPELLDRVDANLSGDEQVEATFKIVAFGDMASGEVESVPFYYSVDICLDCLSTVFGECASLATGDYPAGDTGNACNPYQDQPVSCCTIGGEDVCPAVPGAS